MLNSRMKLVLILALQIILFLLDYPNQHTFILPNTLSGFPQLQVEITIKESPSVEPKTSLDLLCKLATTVKSTQQCLTAFASFLHFIDVQDVTIKFF